MTKAEWCAEEYNETGMMTFYTDNITEDLDANTETMVFDDGSYLVIDHTTDNAEAHEGHFWDMSF